LPQSKAAAPAISRGGKIAAGSSVLDRSIRSLSLMRTLMRTLTAVLAVSLCTAGVATAQMKVPQVAVPRATGPIQPGARVVASPVLQPQQSLESAKRINREDAMKLVRQNKAVYVDVRSRASYDKGHIKGALSIPRSELMTRFKEVPPGKMIITYCACKEHEHTSAAAVLELNAHGVKNAAALIGGWNEWTAAKLPVEMASR
jgi:rhodanese-related sulfurtransferase